MNTAKKKPRSNEAKKAIDALDGAKSQEAAQ